MVEIREATEDDIASFYGVKQEYDMMAWLVVWEGFPAAMAGFVRYNNRWVVFSDIKDGVSAPKLLIFKVAKRLISLMRDARDGLEIAIEPELLQQKEKLYNKLGFTLQEKNGYCWFGFRKEENSK